MAVDEEGLREGLLDAVGDEDGVAEVGEVVEQDGELVAAQAGQGCGLVQRRARLVRAIRSLARSEAARRAAICMMRSSPA